MIRIAAYAHIMPLPNSRRHHTIIIVNVLVGFSFSLLFFVYDYYILTFRFMLFFFFLLSSVCVFSHPPIFIECMVRQWFHCIVIVYIVNYGLMYIIFVKIKCVLVKIDVFVWIERQRKKEKKRKGNFNWMSKKQLTDKMACYSLSSYLSNSHFYNMLLDSPVGIFV